MKPIDKRCLAVAVVLGMLMAGTAVAQTESEGDHAKPKKAKHATKKHPTKKPTAKKAAAEPMNSKEDGQIAAAKAQARAEQEARLKAEAEAKAQRDAKMAEQEKRIQEADALVKAGKSDEAYKLLEPMEFERSGEVRFDYLLGIAALDSGKADKATLAFERVLAMDPNFAGARMDMARAYFQLGDLPRAKTEFEEVLKQDPPEAARVVIQKYLLAIAAYGQTKKTLISGYVEGTLGHDSNVNTGTGSSTALNSLGPLGANFSADASIAPSQRSSSYLGAAGGVDVSHTLDTNWSIYGGADVRQHGNTTQTLNVYDSSSTSGRAGVMYTNEKNAYKLTLTDGDSYTGTTMRTNSLGLSAEWLHSVNPSNQVSAFAQFGQNRAFGYQPTDTTTPKTDVRIEGNTDQLVVGAGWVHTLADGKKVLFGSVSFGNELDVAPSLGQFKYDSLHAPRLSDGRPDGQKTFTNLRVGGQAALTEKIDGFTILGWTQANYAGNSALVTNYGNRKENQGDLTVGANWHLDKLWTVKPQLAYSRKNSNVALYSFDRTDVSLTIRRDFK